MKKFFLVLSLFIIHYSLFISIPPAHAATSTSWPTAEETGAIGIMIAGIGKTIVPSDCKTSQDWVLKDATTISQNLVRYTGGGCTTNADGSQTNSGVLGVQSKFISLLYDNQPSGREYVADLLNNMGVPSVSRAYAQGTGYQAMSPFLEFWKVFRNLAYSLYIIMFVVVGIMIMLRTKINAQTIITIQTALPNLLITLILITFSYAIVGFMIDLMYFLIYFVVYLLASVGIINAADSIKQLMTNSAWSVVFSVRGGIIAAISESIGNVLWSLGTGGIGIAGAAISMVSPMFLIVAVAFAIAMLKLMLALVQSYIMLIVQTITAPVQILMNAMPGSKAFSGWLKKTASYLIPFPVAACMFIFSAILVGNPSNRTVGVGVNIPGGPNLSTDTFGGTNPFGVKDLAGRDGMWLPPFTLTSSSLSQAGSGAADILTIIGFVIFLMTPSAVKMAQEWLQVKESPYASEAFGGFTGLVGAGLSYPMGWRKQAVEESRQKRLMEYQARMIKGQPSPTQKSTDAEKVKRGDIPV